MEPSTDVSKQEDVLQRLLEAALLHPMQELTIHSLQNEVIDKLKSGELALKRAINQTLAIATRCQYRATEAHVRQLLLDAVAQVDGFSAAFAAVLSARGKLFTPLFAGARLVVLRLSSRVLEASLVAGEEAPAWLVGVITAQSLLLEASLEDTTRDQILARKAVLRVIRKHCSTLLPRYVAAITESTNPAQQQYGLWLVVRQAIAPSLEDNAVNEKLWRAYAFWAFESKTRSLVKLSARDPRFKGLTHAQFDDIFKPIIAKLLKKSPDTALAAVTELVRAVPLDLGGPAYLTEIFNSVIVAKIKSTKEDVRECTVALANELQEGFQCVEHFTSLLAQITDLLDGKHGLLAQFYMRDAAFRVLSHAGDVIASLGNREDASTVALSVIPSLLKATGKEAHDQTRHVGMLALGKWLVHAEHGTQPIPKEAVIAIQGGLKNKSEAVVAGYLRALAVYLARRSQARDESENLAVLHPLSTELLRIVKENSKKPKALVHLDGVLALGVAGSLALAWSGVDQQLTGNPDICGLLLDVGDSSFVMASVKGLQAAVNTADDDKDRTAPEVTALVALSHALSWVLSSEQSQSNAKNAANGAHHLLVELLTSSQRAVRMAAETTVRALYASSLDHADALVAALQDKLAAVAEVVDTAQAQNLNKKPSTVVVDQQGSTRSLVPPAGVLRRALRVLVGEGMHHGVGHSEARAVTLSRVMILAHHPYVVTGDTPRAFGVEWNCLKKRFLPVVDATDAKQTTDDDDEDEDVEDDDDRMDHLIEDNDAIQRSIVALLVNKGEASSSGIGLLFSSYHVQRLAAQRMLATLLSFAGNGEGEHLVMHDIIQGALMKRVDELRLSDISEEDVNILETPFDEVYMSADGSASAAKQPSVSRGGGGNEDEKWERQVREELERKKKLQAGSGATKKLSGEEKALLAHQQARRLELYETVVVMSRVLETIKVLAKARPDELHSALPTLLRSFTALFHTRLFTERTIPIMTADTALIVPSAHEALRTLTSAIGPAILRESPTASDLASCLGVVLKEVAITAETGGKVNLLPTIANVVERTLASLLEFVFGFQFDTEDDYDSSTPCNKIAPPTFHLLFPVLSAVLRHDDVVMRGMRHWALPLLAAHAHMIPEEEEEEVGDVAAQRMLRREMLDLALLLLTQAAAGDRLPITNVDLAPQRLLTNLCTGPVLSMNEWAPLLGDRGLLSASSEVRAACLTALRDVAELDDEESQLIESDNDADSTNAMLTCRLFAARFDDVPENRETSHSLWERLGLKLPTLFAGPLLVLLDHTHANVRESASLALADGMSHFPETITPIVSTLKAQFARHAPKELAMVDEFGNPRLRARPGQGDDALEEDEATYLPRCGVALCFEKMATVTATSKHILTDDHVQDILSFVMDQGLVDQNSAVRAQMRKTGIQLIDSYGGQGNNTAELLAVLERALDKKPASSGGKNAASKTEGKSNEMARYDHQREGVVVCLGALAKHMDRSDPKVASIVDALVDALSIPSESVQRSVASCLAPLIPVVGKERGAELLTELLTRAMNSETFGERIGAAFGVSAVVKGLGISSLKQHTLIPRIEESMKANAGGNTAFAREGAMLVFECLSERLGLLFEPYIIVILPIMLRCVADSSPQVRDAATQTSKKIMANLSAHGVKLVLPSVLRAMDDSSAWRTKQAGIQLLGSMAYCAPRQLGSCLPQVVPTLTVSLTDSHPRVRDASKDALRDIGSVVRNPEIASISNALLNALQDPNKHTNEALQKLQSTTFQHAIDAPSLALVMPILTRGLKDRGGDAKKKAALIVGSMCSMIHDAKDLAPYMDMVLPSLKALLMDPIPEVRAVSAKALGKLVKGLGERHFANVLTWLLDAIKDVDYGSVERSGAAQGLCEVLVALGKERVDTTLHDEILPLSRHPKFAVREGVLWIIAFLPPALGKAFAVWIRDTLPIVVSGLSDEQDSVRDVAMHAGHVIVNAHALSHTREILPSLEAGLFDDSWRIRQSSVTLLGDLMYRISGTRAVGLSDGDLDEDEDDGDDAAGSAAGDKAIIKTLGMDRRNAILASLYMIRSDTSALVRQSSLQVWKSVVANTPKTLRQILPTLMSVIVSALSGSNIEKQTMAGRTLGEIVRKLGENVLPEVVPILRGGLSKEHSGNQRQGACVGLTEVIECCNKKQLEDFVTTLVDAILDGLCDELPTVRSSAALAFNGLHRSIGYRAIDETVPSLLQRIRGSASSGENNEEQRALDGLQEMLRVKSREVLPYLIPRLLTTPLVRPCVRAMSRVAQATGAVIHYQLEKIFGVFIPEYLECLRVGAEKHDAMLLAEEIKHSLRDIILAVGAPGVHWLAIEMCKHCESEITEERVLAFYLIAEFCGNTKTDYTDQAALFLRQIVVHLNDGEEVVVRSASAALQGMNATIRPELFMQHIDFIRQGINSMVSDARHRKGGVGATTEFLLPGLCIPKALEPFLPSYQYALMNGSPEMRQSAASGLGELVLLSSTASLRPYLIKLTGPLIRIAGDRFPGHVKAAILETLEIILVKGGVALKPFLPQLQTTFVKALNDTSSEVRGRGTSALSKLVALSPRIDALVAELTEKLSATTGGIREANLDALSSIVERVGTKLSVTVRAGLEEALMSLSEDSDDSLRIGASSCLAMVVASDVVDSDASERALRYGLANRVDGITSLPWTRKQSAAIFWERVLRENPSWVTSVMDSVSSVLAVLGGDIHLSVRTSGMKAIAALAKRDVGVVDLFVPILAEGIDHPNKEVCKHAVKIAKRLAKRDPTSMRPHVATLVPVTFQLIKGNNIAVKLSAERALLYLLEVQTQPETLAEYVRNDPVNGKVISEYARRVLGKLKADSGDESE